nr:trihelix transcription factor GT-3b-like [Tanacetum cinerariifolium]
MFNTTTTSGDMNTTNNETLAHLTHMMMMMMMMSIPQEQPVIISGGVGEVEEYGRVSANKGLWEVVGVKMKDLGYAKNGDRYSGSKKRLVAVCFDKVFDNIA